MLPSHGTTTRYASTSNANPVLPSALHRGFAGTLTTSWTRAFASDFAHARADASSPNGRALSCNRSVLSLPASKRGFVPLAVRNQVLPSTSTPAQRVQPDSLVGVAFFS